VKATRGEERRRRDRTKEETRSVRGAPGPKKEARSGGAAIGTKEEVRRGAAKAVTGTGIRFHRRLIRGHQLGASPPLEGGPTFAEAKPTANSGRGNYAKSSHGEVVTPSPKIAAASRRRFVGPPSRGGLGARDHAFDFSMYVSAICGSTY
jgi:hypothetical protein